MSQAPAASSDEPVLLRADRGAVAHLTLNRPRQMNALSEGLMSALQAELDRIAADRSIRVVVLGAAGKGFCAGHDLKEVRQHHNDRGYFDRLLGQCSRLMLSITRLPQPVIAKVHGIATAAGCQLVATCDLAIASRAATFQTPGVNIGMFCSTPSVAISRNMHSKHALDMLFTADPVDADTARGMGLVSRVVAPEELDAATDALADHIATKSPLAMRIGKEMYYRQREMDLEAAYAYASRVMADNAVKQEAADGIDAFINKQPLPRWRGE